MQTTNNFSRASITLRSPVRARPATPFKFKAEVRSTGVEFDDLDPTLALTLQAELDFLNGYDSADNNMGNEALCHLIIHPEA